jgi:hypothetical protein
MIVLPQGGVVTRPGTRFVREFSNDEPNAETTGIAMWTFDYDPTDYLVILTELRINVYAASTGNFGAPVFSAATPYSGGTISKVAFVQLQDSLLFLTATKRMRVLRLRQNVWSFFDGEGAGYTPPMYDFRDQKSPPRSKIEYSVSFVITPSNRLVLPSVSGQRSPGNIVIVKNSPTQTLNNITLQLANNAATVPGSVSVIYTGNGSTLNYSIEYTYVSSVGDGTGLLQLIPWGDWGNDDIDQFLTTEGTSGAEPLWSGPLIAENDGVEYRCIAPHFSAPANEPGVGASWTTYWILAGTLDPNTDYTKTIWADNQPYGPYNRGWPSTGTGHEQRLVANGSPEARGVIAGSRTGIGKLLDFTTGPDDSDGFVFLLTGSHGLGINWLHSLKLLIVGTSAGFYVQTAVPITPTNVAFSQQSALTLASIPGINVSGEVFYIQRNKRSVRQIQYVDELQSWQSTDMTAYSEHLFKPGVGIKDMVYHPTPDSLLWFLRDDNAWLGFTYEKFYGVTAWHKHASQDPVIHVESMFNGVNEQLVMLFNRREWLGGEYIDRLYLEVLDATSVNELSYAPVFQQGDWAATQTPESGWLPRVDSYQVLAGNGSVTLTVSDRFGNRSVSVIENGVWLGEYLVDQFSLAVTLPNPTILGSYIVVGYSYKARVVPNRIELAAGVTSQPQKIRWTRPMLRLFASTMPLVNGRRPREREQDDLYDTSPALFTGDVEIGNLGSNGELVIEVDRPLPFHMTGIFGLLSVEDGG